MSVKVSIPTIFRSLTDENKWIEVKGENVSSLIEEVEQMYPGVKEKLIEDKKVRRFVNIYVNDTDIRFADSLETTLNDGDVVTILPAVAGGC